MGRIRIGLTQTKGYADGYASIFGKKKDIVIKNEVFMHRVMSPSLKISCILPFDDMSKEIETTVDSLLASSGEHRLEIIAINVGSYHSDLAEKVRWKSRTLLAYRPEWSTRDCWERGLRVALAQSPDFVVFCHPEFEASPGFFSKLNSEKTHYKTFVPYSNYYTDASAGEKSETQYKNPGGFCIMVPAACARTMKELPPLKYTFVGNAVIDMCARSTYTVSKLAGCYAKFVERSLTKKVLYLEHDSKTYQEFVKEHKPYEELIKSSGRTHPDDEDDIYSNIFAG